MTSANEYPRFRWYMLLCLVSSNIAVMSVMLAPSALVDKIAPDLHVASGTVFLLTMSLLSVASLFSLIVSGYLIDRLGMVWCWIAAMILILLSSLLWPVLSRSIAGLVILRITQGIAIGPVMAAVASLSAAWFKKSEMSFVTGFLSASVGLGISLGLVATPLLLRMTGSWRMAMAVMGSFAIISLALNIGALFGPKAPVSSIGHHAGASNARDFKHAWSRPATFAVLGVLFLNGWGIQSCNVLMPNYLATSPPVGQGLGALAAGVFVSLIAYGVLGAGLFVGVVNERIFGGNSRRTLMVSSVVAGLLCLCLILSPICQSPAILATVMFLAGLAFGLVPPILFAFLARNYSLAVLGRLGGIMQGAALIGTTAGVTAGSIVLNGTGSYIVPIVLVSAVALLAALASMWIIAPSTPD